MVDMNLRQVNIFALLLLLLTCQSSVKAGKKRRKKIIGCPTECTCIRVDIESDATEADCRSQNLNEVPLNFGDQEHWIEVDLRTNNISEIGENTFNNIHRVEKLKLSQNRISKIHPNSFKSLHSLTYLSIERNQVSFIPPHLFSDSRNIKNLHLTSNLISNLTGQSFVGLHNLEQLLLDDNLLTTISIEAFQKTPKLKILTMAMNKITHISDDAFTSLKELLVLDLRENLITRIEEKAFEPLPWCEELDLSYNRLQEYPRAVTKLEKLIRLDLNNNEIVHIPNRAFSRQIHLKILTLHNNRFLSVGRWTFSRLPNLTSLLLLNLQEQHHFPSLSASTNLKNLQITGSRITTLPKDFCFQKTHLTRLILSDNRLYDLSAVGMCTKLKTLDVSRNCLTGITNELMNLTALKDVNLSDNDIASVGMNSFANIAGLEKLNMASNPISKLSEKGLGKLNILNVSDTRNLVYLPSMQAMPSLHHLHATYPYHCCLLISNEKMKNSVEDKNARSIYTCSPAEGPLTPCSDLLEPGFTRILLWIVLVLTLFFNCFIILLSNSKRFVFCTGYSQSSNHSAIASKNRKEYVRVSSRHLFQFQFLEVLLCHLCLADLIAIFYVVIIVIYDAKSGGNFIQDAAWWQESIYCRAAGFSLVLGLQLGFYTVFVATLERYFATMYPLNPRKHFKKPVLALSLCIAWIISIASAVVTMYHRSSAIIDIDANPLPPYNGALCLPWSTDFTYVAVLVGAHILAFCVMIVLCALMYCKKQKQSWLCAGKNTRTQVSLMVACNFICMLPLAFLGLLVSVIITFPSAAKPWMLDEKEKGEAVDEQTLNVKLMLIIALLLICIRFLLNPVLYVCFSKQFREDFVQMLKAIVCMEKEKIQTSSYQNSHQGKIHDHAEMLLPYFDNQERFLEISTNLDILHTLPYCIANHSSDISEQAIYPPTAESESYSSQEEHGETSFSPTSEHQHLLCYSSDVTSYPNDTSDSSSTGETFPPVEIYPDILEDPFCDPEVANVMASDASHHYYSSSDDQLQNLSKMESPDEDVGPEPKTSNTPINKPNSFSHAKLNRLSAVSERKRKRLQLIRQKQDQKLLVSNGQMLSQSGESSTTSKDSGIQSEPDFGAVAQSSSTSSSLSRSSNDMDKQSNVLPVFLIPPSSKTGTHKKRAQERSNETLDNKASCPVLQPRHHESSTYYLLHSSGRKILLKQETTL